MEINNEYAGVNHTEEASSANVKLRKGNVPLLKNTFHGLAQIANMSTHNTTTAIALGCQ